MVYIVDFVNRKPEFICKIDFRSVLSSVYRLLVKASSIKTAIIVVPVFFYVTLVIGLQNAVANPLYDEPGINPYREQASQLGEDSVDPFMGQVKLRHLDLFLPGNGGLDIRMWRTYDSANVGIPGNPLGEGFGVGWTSHVGRLLNSCEQATENVRPVLELPDGEVHKFSLASSSLGYRFVSKEGWVGNCISSGGMLLISPEGVKYEMSVRDGGNGVLRWLTKTITDKNGNWLNFEYGLNSGGAYPLRYLTGLNASDGRYVTLQYGSAGIGGIRKLTNMYSNGQSWSYQYVTFDGLAEHISQTYALKKVTRPDGLSWTFEYPTIPGYNVFLPLKGYLGKLTQPHGVITDYSYGYPYVDGFNAVRLTKKSVWDPAGSSSNTWNYGYKFRELANGVYVTVTKVTDSVIGTVTYQHVNNNVIGQAWRFGLLVDKLECTYSACTNREQYEWGYQQISSDKYVTSNGIEPVIDYTTYRPLLTKKTVTRDGTAYSTQYLSHDSYGNPGRVIESGNGVTRTTDRSYYNNPGKWIIGQPAREVIDGTWVTDRSFDSNGNVVSIRKNGVSTTFSYSSTGDIASVTDANYNRTDFGSYYRGVPGQESQPGSVTIYRSVNATGTVSSETNGESGRTGYTYDSLNRLTQVSPPTGNPTSIRRGSNSETKRRGNFEETSQLDGYGRTIDSYKLDVVNSTTSWTRQSYRYDIMGRKLKESYPTGSSSGIDYIYDNLDRVVTIRHADGRTRQLQYLAGNQTRVTNENGQATTYTYRSFGDPDERQLMSVSAPVSAANLAITRNALGQVTSMSQAGVTRSMGYDSRGFLSQTYHPEIGLVTYGRDAVGNPISKSVGVAPNVRTINYAYDTRNRLITTTFQDATTPPVTLAYNRVDDVISASRGAVTRTYGYDLNRNLTNESLLVDNRTFNLSYLYDGNDATTQVTYPDGQTVSFSPDAFGRPTVVSPYVTSVAYHPTGQVSGMSYANGVTTTQTFNTRLWPEQMSVGTSATSLINTTYGYDGLGNVTSMTDSVNAGYNRTLGYDAIDRLVSATGPWGAGSIAYDGHGNILSQNYGAAYAKSYTYDTANRLASYTGSTAFTYDAWGNATRSGTALSYHLYDDASNLYCASCDTASPIQFEYDANNYRVKKTRNGIATYSLYAKDGNLMMEYTPSTGDLKQFAYHNKKQIALRHVVDPALNLGQVGIANANKFATAIPRKPVVIEADFLAGLMPSTPLLSAAVLAHAN